MAIKEEAFRQALHGKKVPILTLDNKWYRLFDKVADNREIAALEMQLNDLLKRQGKLNTESRDIRRLKKKLMNEIVPLVDEYGSNSTASIGKQIDDHKRLVADCNKKLEDYRLELEEIPRKLEDVNLKVMLATMEYCYITMQDNTREITAIGKWVDEVRVELKKNLIRKQEKEIRNRDIYAYMHDIFGADVIDIFDMTYNPGQNGPKVPQSQQQPDREFDPSAE